MAFNHYAKMKRILMDYPAWRVVRIDEPTKAQNFKGEMRTFDHYYRVVDAEGAFIKYCKFQQLDKFAECRDNHLLGRARKMSTDFMIATSIVFERINNRESPLAGEGGGD